jgi:hypothetical protein
MKKIEFICKTGNFIDADKPVPAKSLIPAWYKKMKPYFGQKDLQIDPQAGMVVNRTIKKCIPVLDAITSGYIITTYADLNVTRDSYDNIPYFTWASTPNSIDAVSLHFPEQVENYPGMKEPTIPKFRNIWTTKTPPGYSCLFIPPAHHDTPFSIFPGIVDTDKYTSPVEFPFMLKDPNFIGVIPRGTPIAQVIPFKRDSWKSYYSSSTDVTFSTFMRSFFIDGYKKMVWSKKSFD